MAFNFGDKPLKYSLPQGYQPVISARPEQVVVNSNGQQSSSAGAKIINNAPQAVIIEVIYSTICVKF